MSAKKKDTPPPEYPHPSKDPEIWPKEVPEYPEKPAEEPEIPPEDEPGSLPDEIPPPKNEAETNAPAVP